MKKDNPIILKDSEEVRNIVVKVDLKKNKTTVFSGFLPGRIWHCFWKHFVQRCKNALGMA